MLSQMHFSHHSTYFNISRVTHAASVRELMLIFWCVLYLCSACNIISEEVTEQPVPHSYCLPTSGIPQWTRQALNDKAPINNSMRKDILQAIYDDITTTYGKFYLSGTEYDIIAGAVLREYPYIARAEGLQPADSKNL